MEPYSLDGRGVTLEAFGDVARHSRAVELSPAAVTAMDRARRGLHRAIQRGDRIYGVNTGFGDLARVVISAENAATLQENLVRSHAVGCGPPLDDDETRGAMLLKASDLSMGYSGARSEVARLITALLNAGIHPVIPAKGSLAASGDLAPLAHLALVLMGRGEARVRGKSGTIPGEAALASASLERLHLGPKEGLSLLNGTQVTTAILALTLLDANELVAAAEIAGAMSLEALRGRRAAFDERITAARPHPGAAITARNLRQLTEGSEIPVNGGPRLQDPYSLRCMPQVIGAVRDALEHVREVVERELRATTDNPILVGDGDEILSGGNFHGEPIGLAADYLAIAVAELANQSERRIDRMLDQRESGLPGCLVADAGLNSGLMITQYTAAALVSENKVLAHPASVDSIPTSAGLEDHVSMGCHGARKAREVARNVRWVLATELVCAAQALDFHAPAKPGRGVRRAHALVRELVAPLHEDREVAGDIGRVAELIESGRLRSEVTA